MFGTLSKYSNVFHCSKSPIAELIQRKQNPFRIVLNLLLLKSKTMEARAEFEKGMLDYLSLDMCTPGHME